MSARTTWGLSLLAMLATATANAQSMDDLFGDDLPKKAAPAASAAKPPAEGGLRFSGSLEAKAAYTMPKPEHWSNLRLRGLLNAQGGSGNVKWKLGARADGDAAYAGMNEDIYPAPVRKDQKLGFELRENYADVELGDVGLRLGKQHIVWGEMVGLFVADVVSPRDRRDYLSLELEPIRRTQWAARAEHFAGDWHSEVVLIPVQTYDKIGKPGADFYPYPTPPTPGYAYVINDEQRPERNASNMGGGLRSGFIKNGWDVSGFAYISRDVAPTYERQVVTGPTPATIYTPVHDRIRQFGGTVSKDLDGVVLKAEGVYTNGRRFTVNRLDDADGLLAADSFDYAVGADFTLPADLNLYLQLTQRVLTRHDVSMNNDKVESGGSVVLKRGWGNWESSVLWASSLNRNEGWVNTQISYRLRPNSRIRFGAEWFYGPATGYFGRYDANDRVWTEFQQSF
ncbi:DUF1302 family protein [Uliginosibacterium sp. H1]|uniref:DUF1302 family protein n=1 Tax=Uliginosibacterium sp. H1 TaxID=3114757 RepID=UPI002E194AB5|nr:DUF1302 family protein [Uliginosibacterium sp. H1]